MSENSNEIIFAIYVATCIFIFLLLFSFVIIYNYVKIKVGKEKEILAAIFKTAESERNRIADDLHDSLGSNIAVLKMYNESLLMQTESADAKKILQKNTDIIDKAMQEIHQICRNQSGKFLIDNGIVHELEYLQNVVSGLIRLQLFHTENIPELLSTDFKIHLFRIIQELLQNAVKHSQCKVVTIEFKTKSNDFSLIFSDDGIGISTVKNDRSGMKNITGRVKIFTGSHDIIVLNQKGTQHVFHFPLKNIL